MDNHHGKQWSVVIVGLFSKEFECVYSKEASKYLMLALPVERTSTLRLVYVSMFALFNTC